MIPDLIGNANVICYARMNLGIPTKHTQHFVKGKLLNVLYGLAICQYPNENGYYLFGCDDKWVVLSDSWHQTIEDARDQAEYEYSGITQNWILID